MKSMNLVLNSIEKVKLFANMIGKYDGDFDLVSGRFTVDAKSIMGIFSLDLSKEMRLDVHNDEVYDAVCKDFKDFIV